MTPLPDQLLEAAEAEIDERGLEALSLRAVARRVGVSHQAPGHHFGDRSGLLTALAARGFRGLEADLQRTEAEVSGDAPDRLAAVGVAYVGFALGNRASFSVMFRPDVHRDGDPELIAARGAAFGVLLRAVHAAHAEGWGAGQDEETLALTCWSAVHGIVGLWRDGALQAFFDDEDVEAAARRVTAAVTRALASAAT